MIKSILRDSAFYLLSKSSVAIINLVLIYYILDRYGAAEYSKYTICFITSLCISNFTSTWFSQAYLREKDDVSEDFLVSSLIVVLVLIVMLSSIFVFSYQDVYLDVFSFIILTISQSVYLIGRTFLQKNRLIKKFFYYDLIRMIVIALGCFILSYKSASFYNIILSYILGNFLFVFSFRIFIKNALPSFSINFMIKLKSWLYFGFPVALWLTIASSQMLIDRFLMNMSFGDEVTGYYSSYYDLILRTCALFIIPVSNALYPILVENEKKLNSYKSLALKLTIMSLIASVFLGFISYLVLDVMESKFEILLEFDSYLISLMFFGIILWQLALIFQKPLEMQKSTKVMVFNIICSVIFSTLLNLLLVDSIGIVIFSYSLSLSALLYLALTYFSVKK
ncbi:hypothetical protein BCT09_09225 [Vibrio splendidus]|uniref:oligosaccharide flippase family protein n=1 Tax=Vibrio splendidus TaxID=29497 RepID=UPI000C82CAFC|nr:oligosaccharide flippase family protein [Vibrio splendidus]PMO38696.1 hypothetical protein BCT09_09225 [Vibrio splendidus]